MLGKRLSGEIKLTTIEMWPNDVTITIKKCKWKLTGHIIRGNQKWTKTTKFWYKLQGIYGLEQLTKFFNWYSWRPLPIGK